MGKDTGVNLLPAALPINVTAATTLSVFRSSYYHRTFFPFKAVVVSRVSLALLPVEFIRILVFKN